MAETRGEQGHKEDTVISAAPTAPIHSPIQQHERLCPIATARAGRGNSKPGERQHGHRRGPRGGGDGDAGEEGARHHGAPRALRLEEEGLVSRPPLSVGNYPTSTRPFLFTACSGLGVAVPRAAGAVPVPDLRVPGSIRGGILLDTSGWSWRVGF